jgi:hypothetical protein
MEVMGRTKQECYYLVGVGGVAVYCALLLLTMLSVSLTWLDIAVSAQTLSETRGSRLSILIYGIAVAFILAVAIILFTAPDFIVFALFIFALIGVGVTYFLGASKLRSVLKLTGSERMNKIFMEIQRYALSISFCCLVC